MRLYQVTCVLALACLAAKVQGFRLEQYTAPGPKPEPVAPSDTNDAPAPFAPYYPVPRFNAFARGRFPIVNPYIYYNPRPIYPYPEQTTTEAPETTAAPPPYYYYPPYPYPEPTTTEAPETTAAPPPYYYYPPYPPPPPTTEAPETTAAPPPYYYYPPYPYPQPTTTEAPETTAAPPPPYYYPPYPYPQPTTTEAPETTPSPPPYRPFPFPPFRYFYPGQRFPYQPEATTTTTAFPDVCTLKPGNSAYTFYTSNDVEMDCAPGTVFDIEACVCVADPNAPPPTPAPVPSFPYYYN